MTTEPQVSLQFLLSFSLDSRHPDTRVWTERDPGQPSGSIQRQESGLLMVRKSCRGVPLFFSLLPLVLMPQSGPEAPKTLREGMVR